MASAQVLPNSSAVSSSRKQGHLELGKKKLEEFRKKKAAKKAAANVQLTSADANQHQIIPGNNHLMPDQVVLGREDIVASMNGSIVTYEDNKTSSTYRDKLVNPYEGIDSSLSTISTTLSNGNYSTTVSSGEEAVNENVSKKLEETSNLHSINNGNYDQSRETNEHNYIKSSKSWSDDGFSINKHFLLGSDNKSLDVSQKNDISRLASLPNGLPSGYGNIATLHGHRFDQPAEHHTESLPNKSDGGFAYNSSSFSHKSSSTSDINKADIPVHSSNTLYDTSATVAIGSKISDAIGRRLNIDSSPWRVSEPSSSSTFGFESSADQVAPQINGSTGIFGRSRPSFLDSIGVPRVPLTPNLSHDESQKVDPPEYFDRLLLQNSDTAVSSSMQQLLPESNSRNPSISPLNADFNKEKEISLSNSDLLGVLGSQQDTNSHAVVTSRNFQVANKDEDFTALEQHIEDLTKEKFSLQRALETAQTLSESLASENSSLAEGFNQQGKVINQLKADMENLQEEIKTQLLALESVKLEYTKAKLECNAADERAKMLASEVISLEEKALRLRSNELKQEKELENLYSEISSYKRKISTLEKERQDLQSTVTAMQEEKKLMQSKFWKTSLAEKANVVRETSVKVDASTSTEPIDLNYQETSADVASTSSRLTAIEYPSDSEAPLRSNSQFASHTEDGGLNLSDSFNDLPQDQLGMIANIKALLSEVALEKEALVQALRIESSNCSKLKEMNRDLSQKLETQTQRLELLTSQRMANENIRGKTIDTLNVHEATDFADEGDEVVERVLGWIMKLFPGGPSKRRASKLM